MDKRAIRRIAETNPTTRARLVPLMKASSVETFYVTTGRSVEIRHYLLHPRSTWDDFKDAVGRTVADVKATVKKFVEELRQEGVGLDDGPVSVSLERPPRLDAFLRPKKPLSDSDHKHIAAVAKKLGIKASRA